MKQDCDEELTPDYLSTREMVHHTASLAFEFLKEVRKTFMELDLDRDGYISKSDVRGGSCLQQCCLCEDLQLAHVKCAPHTVWLLCRSLLPS